VELALLNVRRGFAAERQPGRLPSSPKAAAIKKHLPDQKLVAKLWEWRIDPDAMA